MLLSYSEQRLTCLFVCLCVCLFTELCKTHSWSYSRGTSEGLWKHSPADHLSLWSMIFYCWGLFAFIWCLKTKICFRWLNALSFVGRDSAYPKKISLLMQPKCKFCSLYLQIFFPEGGAEGRKLINLIIKLRLFL